MKCCNFLSAVVNIRFGRPNVTVDEDDGEFMMCVVKDRDTAVPVNVTITTSPGSATEGQGEREREDEGETNTLFLPSCSTDYNPANVPGYVVIPGNASMACFTSDSVLDDEIALEDNETFVLSIDEVDPDDPRVNVPDEDTTVIILDEDGKNHKWPTTVIWLAKKISWVVNKKQCSKIFRHFRVILRGQKTKIKYSENLSRKKFARGN